MRTVWIVNHYAALESKDGWAGRHQSLAKSLSAHNWGAVLFLSGTTHPGGRSVMTGTEKRRLGYEDGVSHVMLRTPEYSGNGRSRIVNMGAFALRILAPGSVKDLPAPDVVIGSTVHPAAAYAGWRLARRYGVPFVFEIRDVWPDALIHLGQLRERSIIARMMRSMMHRLVRKADLVLSPLPRIADYVRPIAAIRETLWIANGIEGKIYGKVASSQRNAESFTVMYLGSLGAAMDLETVINAVALMADGDRSRDVHLRIVGDGARRTQLIRFAEQAAPGLRVTFEDRVPRSDVLAKAAEADCLVHALHDHQVYEYGISPNKIFDYMLSSRPVAFAANAPMNPVEQAAAGRVVPPEDATALAAALEEIAKLSPEERDAMGQRGRTHVLSNYTYDSLAARLAAGLDALVKEKT